MRVIVVILACAFALYTAQAAASTSASPARNAQIIRAVFGTHGSAAVRVASCESGLSEWARNGQYQNLFQMGYAERRRYGWHVAGSSPWLAAKAAYRYFKASGYSWRAWTCQP